MIFVKFHENVYTYLVELLIRGGHFTEDAAPEQAEAQTQAFVAELKEYLRERKLGKWKE